MIPDAPKLPSWVLAYAEYEGQRLALIDHWAAGCRKGGFVLVSARFTVSTLLPVEAFYHWSREHGPLPCWQFGRDCDLAFTDDEAEARAIFEREAERLLEKAVAGG